MTSRYKRNSILAKPRTQRSEVSGHERQPLKSLCCVRGLEDTLNGNAGRIIYACLDNPAVAAPQFL